MNKIKKVLLAATIFICNLTFAQCWFSELVKDFGSNTPEFKKFIGENPNALDIYSDLSNNGGKYLLKNAAYLTKLGKLNPQIRKYVVRFTDVDANSTLKKFLDDVDDPEFLKFVNNPENEIYVKGFLAHKDGVLNAAEKEVLAELLERGDEIPGNKAKKWLEYGENMAVFKANREAGIAWGNLMREQLANPNSQAYKELKRTITDLDEYSIYSQVLFCLKGDCISKGNYWTPDFVLVKEVENVATGEKHLEAIIVDSKLSAGTGWTPNQTAAQKMTGWNVKSGNNLIKGNKIENFEKGTPITRKGEFIKLYNEGGVAKVK